jgi:hypothetical protein
VSRPLLLLVLTLKGASAVPQTTFQFKFSWCYSTVARLCSVFDSLALTVTDGANLLSSIALRKILSLERLNNGCDLFHIRPQESTANLRRASCQLRARGLLSTQIEPGSSKNFAAQLNEGARIARFLCPQFFA